MIEDRAGGVDVTDEPAVFGEEPDNHSGTVWFGIHLNVGIAARRKEAFDACAHLGHAQRLPALEREKLKQFGGIDGLFDRHELNVDDILAFVFLRLRPKRCRFRQGRNENQTSGKGEPRPHHPHDSVSRS